MRSETEILSLVIEARAGDDRALEALCEEITDEPGFRIWAERTAPRLTLVDGDGVLQMLRQATVSAALDDGSMRWDCERGTPFKTWVYMVCHDRCLHVELRAQGAARRTAPGGWVDVAILEEFGMAPAVKSGERQIEARDALERIFEELRRNRMTTQVEVLQLMWEGYPLGEIAMMLFGGDEQGKALGRVRYALKSARSFCRSRRERFLGEER